MRKSILIMIVLSINLIAKGQDYEYFDTSFYSQILSVNKSMRIYLPPGYNDDTLSYPIVYYLHGATGSYLEFTPHMQDVENMIDTGHIHPTLVVGLDGQCDPFAGSMYTNSVLYGNYEDYIIEEAIPFAETVLRTKNSPHYRCLMGFAMGGYGSVKFAAKYADLFEGVASFNGPLQFDTTAVLWLPEVLSENSGPPYNYHYSAGIFTQLLFTGSGGFSPNLDILPWHVEFLYDTSGQIIDSVIAKWKLHDCSRLVKNLDPTSHYPGLFIACGINDFLYFHPTNVCFVDTLEELGLNYEFLTTNDGHVLSNEILAAGMYFLDSVMNDSVIVDINELAYCEDHVFRFYPNPFSGPVNLRYMISDCGYVIFELFEVSGTKVKSLTIHSNKVGDNEIGIDLSDLPTGVYFCTIKTNKGIFTQKIIKL